MNRITIVITAILLLSVGRANAQFNTVFLPVSRYEVEVEHSANAKETIPESTASEIGKSAPGNVSLSGTDSKKEKQVAHYLVLP